MTSGFVTAVNGRPTRKWAGVRGCKSWWCDNDGVSGLELRIARICVSNLYRFSKVSNAVPITRLIWCFVAFKSASQIPLKFGLYAGMNFQLNVFLWTDCLNYFHFFIKNLPNFFRAELAPIKLRPLSEYILAGIPRLDAKRQSTMINGLVDKSEINSKWMARVKKHMNKLTLSSCALDPFDPWPLTDRHNLHRLQEMEEPEWHDWWINLPSVE